MSSLTWRNEMPAAFAPESTPDASFTDEFDDPIVEWTLDELDHSADLGSLRSAWAAADDLNE
jgi:hypothetical protein